MKTKYFQRLSTKLSLLPMLLVTAILIAGGGSLYFYGQRYLSEEILGRHIAGVISEKRNVIDSRIEKYLKDLTEISGNPIVRDNTFIISKELPGADKETIPVQKRRAGKATSRAQAAISATLDVKAESGEYKILSLLSADGKVFSSSRKEMEGEDWSGRDFYKNAARMKAVSMTGFYNCDSGYCMEFVGPVLNADGEVQAILHSLTDMKELTDILKTVSGPYKTGKVEMIDKAGNVLLTGEGVPSKKIRYNISGESTNGGVRYRDDLFFNITGLKHAPFRLIYTVSGPEVIRPLYVLLIAYGFFCMAIMLIMMVQKAYVTRIISRPVARLVNAVRLIALNDLDTDMGKNYRGELQDLRKEMENMVEMLKTREARLRENIEHQERSALRPVFFNNISREAIPRLAPIVQDLEHVLENESGLMAANRKIIGKVAGSARVLLSMMEGLLDLSGIEQGQLSVSPEEFNVCGLLEDIEGISRELAGLKDIEFVIDCHDVLKNKTVYIDKHLLRRILMNLAGNAVMSTDVGTVTIIMSENVREGVEYFEASVADTGSGISPEELEQISDESNVLPACLWLAVSKKLTEAMGGRMEIESRVGKGSAITVTIPLKARIY